MLHLPTPHSSPGRKEFSGCQCNPRTLWRPAVEAYGSKLSSLCQWFIEQSPRRLQLPGSRGLFCTLPGMNEIATPRRQLMFKGQGTARDPRTTFLWQDVVGLGRRSGLWPNRAGDLHLPKPARLRHLSPCKAAAREFAKRKKRGLERETQHYFF